jgi:hypothetical protein
MNSCPHLSPKLLITLTLFLAANAFNGPAANSQDTARLILKDDGPAQRLEQMRQLARAFKVVAIEGENRIPLQLGRDPLHRFTDPTRQKSDGVIWVWRLSGRPIAVLAIEPEPEIWSFEFVSLSTGRVAANNGNVRWEPATAGVEFHEIPDTPAPAERPAERLRQMRDIVKRFSAQEFWHVTGIHYPLRLLPHPIDRYSDATAGVVDGTVFIFANTTNPEVLLVIEARRSGKGAPTWSYAAAPVTTAAPTLLLDRKEVWSSGSKFGYLAGEPYFFGRWNRDRSQR